MRLRPNKNKILGAITTVIAAAERQGHRLTQYDILKTMFLADRSHLNEYGRPITYDNYVAMTHCPVPSAVYDFLKGNEIALKEHSIAEVPWQKAPVGEGKFRYYSAQTEEFRDYLSESDLEALLSSLSIVKKLGFGQVRKLTHEDPAYLAAWQPNGGRAAYDMSLALFFEEPNMELARELSEFSEYVQAG